MDKPIIFYEKDKNKMKCTLCPHNCYLEEGKFGVCKVRTVKDSVGIATNYGEITSANIDPIEKKPLYHFKPSKNILSIGTFGCNMSCSFCQNYEISQFKSSSEFMEIEQIIKIISTVENNAGIAFTYNEPFMWYEYVYDTVKKIKETNKDISVVLVTNGYINKEPLEKLLPYVDAMNIDLKGYSNKYYNNICGASLEPVLETIKFASGKCHIEITTLMVEDENDSIEEIGKIAQFIASIDKNIPLHLSRYFPRYNMNNAATDIEKIINASVEARKHLNYVYIGNVGGINNDTYCPYCDELLIKRNGYSTKVLLTDDKCPNCTKPTNMIFK